MEVAISIVLVNIFSTIACGVICWRLGKKSGWDAGIGDAAAEYAKGYNYGVLETIKRLSDDDEIDILDIVPNNKETEKWMKEQN